MPSQLATMRTLVMLDLTLKLAIALSLTLPGCAATFAEPAYAQVEIVPANIYSHPSMVYNGQVLYLVDGRWYYKRGPSWVYVYREPEPLRRYRVDHYRAPQAHPRPSQHYVAPPARRYVAPPARRYVAPPAHPPRRDRREPSRHRTDRN